MILTLVLLGIGALLFVVIGYNIAQQYKQKVEAEKRALMAKQKVVIDETDELLLNVNRVPYTKTLVVMLQQRILNALHQIREVDPSFRQISERINDVKTQLENIKANYPNPDDRAFHVPSSEQEALQMLKVLKKLRAVLRAEYNKGKIDPQGYSREDRRMEVMLLKLNLENLLKRARNAQMTRQFGTAKQTLTKGIAVLSTLSDRDDYLNKKLQIMQKMQKEIEEQLAKDSQNEVQKMQEKDAKDVNELDVLFQPKKKW